jgi:hypothetical protein
MRAMQNLAVQIVRFVDSRFPGWVECELVDAAGHRHIFKDKVPIFTVEDLDANSKYPTPGVVSCEVVEHYKNEKGQELVRVRTVKPYGIESTKGVSDFIVSATQITSSD